MGLGCVMCHGHLVAPTEHKDPETGKFLYAISELKPALTPPLLVTQKACLEYIRKVDPYDVSERVNAYGETRKRWRTPRKARNYSAQKMEAHYGRTCTGYET